MSNQTPSISEAEWEVMKVLWKKGRQTANQVISAIQEQTDWKPKTIRTLLDRLTKKKVVGVDKEQKIYVFFPLYSEEECKHAEAQSFVKRVYGGTVKPLLVQFLEEESLTKEELDELYAILEQKRKE
ncbi:penicillinase repressor BlaI [Shouchella clausii]|uniref:Transcriptional regulator n=1 Tax=Shouchella clausii TaxID=79880 RepID=A0A268S5Q4_SHOCL|nr:penicillinase repressor BlaI [Shouchella clausii]PAD42124.1 transcriptional regulator [Bacillus sp. 7520-S]SPU18857.1 methicillin resistance regulatory protein MecI [Niallia circulans]AST95396.1 transcriptional regulator [Shouchella clausii]MBU8598140.1 penicillinase repressor BlaI [Shouchella clausii]MCM3548769.1 penicillinase repressor BlaI [Shouchella clausii]